MNLQISVWQIPQMLISLGQRTKLKHGMFTRTTRYGDEMHYHWPCWDASACCRCLRKWGSSQLKVWSTSFSMTSAMNMSGKSSDLKPAIFLLMWAPKLPGAARSLSDGRIKKWPSFSQSLDWRHLGVFDGGIQYGSWASAKHVPATRG